MKKKIIYNASSSIIVQLVTIISGLIVPRLIITSFGSEVNGLVGSITQFIAYIALLEAGFGGVVRAALYKPLAENDTNKISAILSESKRYFNKISILFIVYVAVLMLLYPIFVKGSFDNLFIVSLILIISLSTLAQYYIGITYSIFLYADSKIYIINIIQLITVVSNTFFTIILVNFNQNIHIVKSVSALVYILRPIFLMLYVQKNYNIKFESKLEENLLSQKFNGLVHHIAWYLHSNLDIIILSLLGNLKQVSVYTVYQMIVSGLVALITAFLGGLESIFGTKLATDKLKKLQNDFNLYSFLVINVVFVIFYVAFCMIVPFVKLYTSSVSDTNYIFPAFSYVLLLAQMIYCLRIPYHSIVTASGKFKETQNSAFLETLLNLVISIALVRQFGLLGVALGTVIAMLYRTLYYIFFLSNNIIYINRDKHLFRFITTLCLLLFFAYLNINYLSPVILVTTYFQWILVCLLNFIFAIFLLLIVDLLIFRNELKMIIQKIRIVKK